MFRNFFRIPLPLFSLSFLPLPAPCPQAEIISSDHPEFARNFIFKNLWFLVYLWLVKKKKQPMVPVRMSSGCCCDMDEGDRAAGYLWDGLSVDPGHGQQVVLPLKPLLQPLHQQLFPRSVRWMTNSCFSPVHLFSSPSLQQTWWWRWFTHRLKARSSPGT